MAFTIDSALIQVNRSVGTSSALTNNANIVTIVANTANHLTATLVAGLFSLTLPAGVFARVYDDNNGLVSVDASIATTVAAGIYHVVIYSNTAGTFNVSANFPNVPATAQQTADKLALTLLKNKIKSGIALSDDDVIFYMIGDSVVAAAAMTVMDSGSGYDALKTLGLTETQTLDVLSIYNVKISPDKYESELGIVAIDTNKLRLNDFMTYLQKNNVEFPDLTSLYIIIRSKPSIYAALREWNKIRAV